MMNSADASNIAGRVKLARLRAVMSQEDLSTESGVPKATISRIENGHHERPHFGTIRKLAAALNVSASWLLVGDNEPASGDELKIAA